MPDYQNVNLGRRVHLVESGTHRTACNRIVSKELWFNPEANREEWRERTRWGEGEAVTCWVCQRIRLAARNRELDAQYGKGSTLEAAPARRMYRRGQ